MRMVPSAALVALLLLLLSGLSLLGMNPEEPRYDSMISTLARFAITESALRQDILNARTGLLRDYDPLNQKTNALHELIGQLRQEGADPMVLRPLEILIEQQEEMTEKFKTDNALLRNSLAYFSLFSGRFGDAARDGSRASAMTALTSAMLHLTLDTSAASAAEVEDKLNRFAAASAESDDRQLIDGILTHGRLLQFLLPAADEVLRSLYELPRSQRLEAMRASILAQQKASRAEARDFRILLYATSMLLLASLVYVGSQLRRHVWALRRRAAFEHAIATISMDFLTARRDEIDDRVTAALATLAEWVHADRAYFVMSTEPLRLHWWSRDGGDCPPNWPKQASMLVARGAEAGGMVYIAAVDSLPESPEKATLQRAGLRGWLSIPANDHDGSRALLGFDALRKPMTWPPSEAGLLRMAVDTVANAVGHAALERDRARLEASLQQARRMETIGAVASGVAHNFNNIIGAILGYTEMEENHARSDSRQARNLEGIRTAAERARDLIDQILNFGRRKDSPHRNVALQALMAETQSLLSASLPRGARVAVGTIPDAAVVSGDPVQLQQVIINLCNNAVQAMDGPCTVELTIDVHAIIELRQLSQGYLAPGGYVRTTVRDSGRGMDAAAQERLFEPFFTTRLNGNGLGLATVREIVRGHGGAINVSSRLGEGSVFEIWLPQAARPTAPRDDTAPIQGSGTIQGNGETVMVVDGDHARLLHDEEIVAALGYEPVGFVEPEQAVRTCREAPGRFDAVLIGHVVPTAQALALTAELRQVVPKLPILLAASAGELGADVLATAGISEVVTKPLVSAELAAALSRWLPK